ncbi:fimbrial protein [Pantoea agglomerans]|uniref:fimbrial protein n=1 Tax=Enterobacter agglomerans TaxID=549 RepID=UPI002413C4E7|nr:fimbrial protein [Pantoea agglomerans]
MKKVILASLLPVLLASSFSSYAGDAVAPKSVTVDGGKINFTGSVVAAPCAVDNSSDGQTVKLGQVATNQLASKGAMGSAVPFTIKLEGCDLSPQAADTTATTNYTKASIKFTGSSIDATTLALTADGAGEQPAKNVGIEIFQANNAVHIDGTESTAGQDIIAGDNEIPFSATYVATSDDAVIAGSANSSVNFQVTYE